MIFKVCPSCGANLDSGEDCEDCHEAELVAKVRRWKSTIFRELDCEQLEFEQQELFDNIFA